MLFILVAVLLLAAFLQGVTPYLGRHTHAFGVAIPAAHYNDPPLRHCRQGYLLGNLLAGVAAALACLFPWPEAALPWVFGVALAAQLLVGYGFYLHFHHFCRQLKAQAGWPVGSTVAVDLTPSLTALPSAWWLLSFAVLIGLTLLATLALYPTAPGQLPLHANLAGQVDRVVDKSPAAAMLLPGAQLFMAAVFVLVYWITRSAKRQLDPANPERSRRQLQRFRRAWLLFTLVGGNLVLLILGVAQLCCLGALPMGWGGILALAATAGLLLYALVLSLRLGQGGSRLGTSSPAEEQTIPQEDDRYWKMGWLYFNPDDPALFVEKRFGIGWTSNFARPATYLLLGGVLALAALLIWASCRLG